MEIISIQAPTGPIGIKTNIKVCPGCKAVLSYKYEDLWVKNLLGNEINYITCPSCHTDMNVGESKNLY